VHLSTFCVLPGLILFWQLNRSPLFRKVHKSVAPGPAELHSSYTAEVVWAAGELLAGKGFLEKAIPGSKSSFPLLELLEPSKVRYRLMGGSYLLQHWHWHSGWHLSESLSLRVMMAVNARDWHGVGTEHWQSP
jgi:hypothetical protein